MDADGNALSGWPQSTSASISSEPAVFTDADHNAVILTGNDQGDMYGFDKHGNQRFMIDGSGAVKASPAMFMQDGSVFAVFGTTEGNLYLIDILSGTLAEHWPRQVSPVYQSPVCADVVHDTESTQHILAVGNDGKIYAFTPDGDPLDGFPVNTRFLSKSSPAVTDIDHDNDNEIILGTYSGISVIDLKEEAGAVSWAMHRGDTRRSGSLQGMASARDTPDLPLDFQFELIGNAPNPFNAETTVRFIVPGTEPVRLSVYSLSGKQLIERNIGEPETGMNEIRIDMRRFSSGIYLYTLSQNNISKKAKMIFLK
ncbi:MAG: T9SS type A sorting domain-containing protein [Candidatus Marinimicrobia bacterium]|nr:T9SS type A sorting domain-containing protein [Candidatus Neomarinimicrobiota bacterium]